MKPDVAQSNDVRSGGKEISPTESEKRNFYQADGTPDWEAISFDVLCSRCGYNLRTLTRPKCTECGLEFKWRDVLDSAAFRSDFLFEHNWTRRPLQSLFKTVWLSLRPRAFWERVSIHQRVELGPLLFLGGLAVFIFSTVFHGLSLAGAVLIQWYIVSPSPLIWSSTSPPFSDRVWELSRMLDGIASVPVTLGFRYLWVILLIFTPVMAAFGLLCTLWQTLGRYKVRAAQVFRVVAYSAVPAYLWCSALLIVLISATELAPADSFMHFGDELIPLATYLLALIAILGAHLSAGLRHYLLLPRAGALGYTAAFVGLLTTLTLMAALAALQIGIFK